MLHSLNAWELSKAGRPPEEPPLCEDPAQAFLDFALNVDEFRCVVFVGHRSFGSADGSRREPPITDLQDARRLRRAIGESIQVGFVVVIGVRSSASSLRERAAQWGYRVLGQSRFGSEDDYDPSAASTDRQLLIDAVVSAKPLATTVCLFGHDADPLYFIADE